MALISRLDVMQHALDAQRKDEQERIEEAGGFVRHGRLQGIISVSRALGSAECVACPCTHTYHYEVRSVPVTDFHSAP